MSSLHLAGTQQLVGMLAYGFIFYEAVATWINMHRACLSSGAGLLWGMAH